MTKKKASMLVIGDDIFAWGKVLHIETHSLGVHINTASMLSNETLFLLNNDRVLVLD